MIEFSDKELQRIAKEIEAADQPIVPLSDEEVAEVEAAYNPYQIDPARDARQREGFEQMLQEWKKWTAERTPNAVTMKEFPRLDFDDNVELSIELDTSAPRQRNFVRINDPRRKGGNMPKADTSGVTVADYAEQYDAATPQEGDVALCKGCTLRIEYEDGIWKHEFPARHDAIPDFPPTLTPHATTTLHAALAELYAVCMALTHKGIFTSAEMHDFEAALGVAFAALHPQEAAEPPTPPADTLREALAAHLSGLPRSHYGLLTESQKDVYRHQAFCVLEIVNAYKIHSDAFDLGGCTVITPDSKAVTTAAFLRRMMSDEWWAEFVQEALLGVRPK